MRLMLAVLVLGLAAVFLLGMRVHLGDTVAYTRGDRAVICDHQLDGQNAHAAYYRHGISVLLTRKDANGVQAGCGRSGHGPRIVAIRACSGSPYSPVSRCSRWRDR